MAVVAQRWAHQDDYDAMIRPLAAARGVPVALVKAIIARESEFKPSAYRAEPQIDDASRGLMQLLYGTAKALGYTGTAEGLYDPATNLRLGVQLLADNIAFAAANGHGVDAAISAYNGGFSAQRRGDGKRTGDTVATPYINQAYVDWVQEAQRYFERYQLATGASGLATESLVSGGGGALALLGGVFYALTRFFR